MTIAFIVSYSRPFTENKGGKTATSSLSKKCLKSFDASEKELHYQILERRNKAASHSDADLYEAHLSISEDRRFVYPAIMDYPIIFFTRNELLRIQIMIDKLIHYLGETVDSLIQYHGEDFYRYLVEK